MELAFTFTALSRENVVHGVGGVAVTTRPVNVSAGNSIVTTAIAINHGAFLKGNAYINKDMCAAKLPAQEGEQWRVKSTVGEYYIEHIQILDECFREKPRGKLPRKTNFWNFLFVEAPIFCIKKF